MDLNSRLITLGSGSAAGGAADPDIGDAFEGGFFAGYISQTNDGVATHGLIVAPAASGYNGGSTLQWKTTNTFDAATSVFDGAANTAALADTSHPAADYCAGLTIDGYSDWYLPALYELEIAYYNLKPTTDSNDTNHGTDSYAVPPRTGYTSGNPAQASVTAFQSGGTEAFLATSHWASQNYSSTRALGIFFDDGDLMQYNPKTSSVNVRAFRKFTV